jgi:methionyl-tRNA synthetase
MSNYYVTTSIPYVNGDPHIGFAMELIMGDALARAARARGDTVIYCTGTDEHGTKVAEKAESLGKTPKEFTDEISVKFRDLGDLLNVKPDRFIRTTDKGHMQRAQLIWKALQKDIYKAKYVGWYDVRQEEFVPEAQADPERMDPAHPQAYQKLEEENYFFALSKYNEQLIKVIEGDELHIVPKTKRNEIISLMHEGLEDISISRPANKLSWGIPVPGDKTQVMYVWFEALMNYLTVLGYPEHDDYKDFWPANVQIIGKDIIRFHAAIWPAMLLSLGVALPKQLYVHGFVNVDGQKMSKSIGNVIAPSEIVNKYGSDAFRYYFLRHVPSYDDGDFSWEHFEEVYNNELANELGNAVQRTMVMIQKYQGGMVGNTVEAQHDMGPYDEAILACRFDRALDHVWNQVRGLNQFIDQEKPWEIAKAKDEDHLKEVLGQQVSDLLEIAVLLDPFMPETTFKIKHIFESGLIRPLKHTLFPKFDVPVRQ